MNPSCVVRSALSAGGLSLVLATAASASPLFTTASAGNLEASATFAVDPGNPSRLIVTLSNSSMNDVMVPADILTGIFFSITAPTFTLSPVSALIDAGSTVQFGSAPGGVVGGEWAYRSGLTGVISDPLGSGHGISSAGLGLFGNANFPGSNLQGPAAVGGLQHGITSAGDNPATGNSPVTGPNAFVKHSVVFTLTGLPSGFDPSLSIENVAFQYGTSLAEPRITVPAPGSLALVTLIGLASSRRRR